MQDITCKN